MSKLSKKQKDILKHYSGKRDTREAVKAASVILGLRAAEEVQAHLGHVNCEGCGGSGEVLWDSWGLDRVEYCRLCDGYGLVTREQAKALRVAKAS